MKPGSVCLVGQLRNEARGVSEWLDHHFSIGFDHAYLFIDRCTDGTEEVLAPYVAAGRVTCTPIDLAEHYSGPQPKPSREYPFNRALGALRGRYHWAAFFDADEFLWPTRRERLSDILRDLEWASGVVVTWRFFHSGLRHAFEADRSVRRTYTLRAPDQEKQLVKSIVNLNRCVGTFPSDPHMPVLTKRSPPLVTPTGQPLGETACYDRLVLHHYYSKSWQFWFTTKMGRTCWPTQRYTAHQWLQYSAPAAHTVVDDSLAAYAEGQQEDRWTPPPTMQILRSDAYATEEGAPTPTLEDRLVRWGQDGFPTDMTETVPCATTPEEYQALWTTVVTRALPRDFDQDSYRRLNPDIGDPDLVTHYVVHGAREKRVYRDPTPDDEFDSAWYATQNPDVASAFPNPWVHYVLHGKAEGRAPNPERAANM